MNTPCIEWTGERTPRGYGRQKISGRRQYAHRVAVAQVDGWSAIKGKVVMHLCDNPPCVRYDHLRIGTQSDNVRDAVSKGRWGPGGGNAILSIDEVIAIRARYVPYSRSSGTRALAREYGVSPEAIQAIISFRNWRTDP